MATHTKGPWAFHKRGQRVYGGRLDSVLVAQLSINPEFEANGRLIAAAPDLLAALKALRDECSGTPRPSVLVGLLTDAAKAIAKADGGA